MTSAEAVTKKPFSSLWVVQDPKTKIVGIALGHGAEAHRNEPYQRLLINAVRWAGGGL